MKISKIVVPLLMARCREVLRKFIADDKKGGMPIARERLAEVSYILSYIKNLELHPEIEEERISNIAVGKKRHILNLFPLLCDCITTKENDIKQLLRDVFHSAAKELGLE